MVKKNLIFIILFLAALVGLLLPGGVFHNENRSVYYLWESGHVVLFFLGCHLFSTFCPRFTNFSFARQAVILLAGAAFWTLVLEELQSLISGKPVEFTDVIGDIAGTLLFLSFRSLHSGRKDFSLYGIAFLLAGVVYWPVCSSFFDEMLVRYQFPLLADFETPFEASRFEGKTGSASISVDHAFHSRHSLKLSFSPGPWSGLTMKYLPSGWRKYTQLHFALYNPGQQQASLEVVIYDALHQVGKSPHSDLYSRIISLPAGKWTMVRIPLAEVQKAPQTRQMDLAQIDGLGFFVDKETKPLTLYLDDIRLE